MKLFKLTKTPFLPIFFSFLFFIWPTTSKAQNITLNEENSLNSKEKPESEEKAAFIRIWHAGLNDSRLLLSYRSPQTGELIPLASLLGKSNFQVGYRDLPPGEVVFSIAKKGKPEQGIKNFQENLRSNKFYTVVILGRGNEIDVEFLNDTDRPDKKNGHAPREELPAKHVRVFNFIEDGQVAVSYPSSNTPIKLDFGTKQIIPIISGSREELKVVFKEDNAPSVESLVELNLGASNSLSVLIIRDIYGRFSPRILPNAVLD